MKGKPILSVLFLLVLVVLLVTSTIVNTPVDAVSNTFKLPDPTAQMKSANNGSQFATVSGENNPQLIPDRIAYLIVFRLLGSYENETEHKRLRGFVKQNLGITDHKEIEAVFRLADDFKQRVSPVENQINLIKDRYHPSHSPFSKDDRKELEELKKDKEKIVDDLIADIPSRLSADGKDKLHRNIQERVKQKIRIQDHLSN